MPRRPKHARLLDALRRRNRAACVQVLHNPRSSTVAGLPYDPPAHADDAEALPVH